MFPSLAIYGVSAAGRAKHEFFMLLHASIANDIFLPPDAALKRTVHDHNKQWKQIETSSISGIEHDSSHPRPKT